MGTYRRALQGATVTLVGLMAIGLVMFTANAFAEDNIPPTAVDDSATTPQDTPVVIDVLANDSDPDGGTLSVAPGALARATILSANPILLWECYPVGGGAVTDRTGNGNAGNISGGVTAGDLDGDCDGANAFQFPTGTGAVVSASVPAVPQGAAARTFIVRFQAGPELAGGVGIFGTGTDGIDSGQFSISRDWDNNQLIFTGFANDHLIPLPGVNLGDGQEYTIAVVYDGVDSITAYVNGAPGTPVVVGALDTTGTEVMLGRVPWAPDTAGDQLRQFAIFDTALDAGTIGTIHSAIQTASAGQAVTQPANGTVTTDGLTVTYTPNPGFFGEDTFTYSVSDGQGGSASATVTVTVTAVAGAQPDNVTVTTGETLVFDATANDMIPDGVTASITSVEDPANGTASTDGQFITYTPDPGFVGTDAFQYTLETSEGNITTALVTVIVTPANEDPTAVDDFATTTMDKPIWIDVLANDFDPDGDTLWISPGQLARGAILRAGPLLHWECLPESLPSVLHDTSGNGRDGAIGEGVTLGTATGDCDNGTSMTFGGSGGIVTRDNPNLPVGNAPRSALVRYKANHATAPADIPLFGYGQNGTPYAQFTVSRTILGNDKMIFTSWANDLSFDLPPGSNIADGQEHNIMFVYDGDVTVFAYFNGIPSGQGTLAVPLDTIDDTVMLGGSPWGWRSNGDEMRQFAVFPTAINAEDSYLVHAAIEAAVLNKAHTDPLHGTVIQDEDHLGFTYIPDPGFVGTDQFLYSISDGMGGGDIALVTVEVLPGVSAQNDPAFTPVNTPVTIDVLANDTAQPGATLTTTNVSTPNHGTATTDGTTVTYTPPLDFLGIATFTYTAVSDIDGDDTAVVTVNVGGTGDNFPPMAVDDFATTDAGQAVTINVLANDYDPDGDSIAISRGDSAIPGINALGPVLYWACLPAAGASTLFDQSGNGVDGTLSGSVTPGALVDDCGGGTTMIFPNAASFVGRTFPGLPQGSSERTIILRYRTDIANPSTIGLFGFGTNGVGNQQFSVSRNLTGNENLSFSAWGNDAVLQLPASIADGQEHTLAIVYDGNTTITGFVNGIAGTPASLFAPLNTVDSQVFLGKTLWGAVGDAAEMRHFAVFDRALTPAEIADAHDIIESIVHDPAFTQPANGTVTQVGFDQLVYTPNPGFSGTDTFTYFVADGNGGESSALVTVEVEGVPLVANDDTAEASGATPITIDVLSNDTAPPGASLTITAVTTPSNGSATTDGAIVTYTANAGFSGLDTFTYTVEDDQGGEATATVSVTVVGTPLVANDDTATTTGTIAVEIDVLANDTADDAATLTITTVTQPANGTVTTDGLTVTYTAASGFTGDDTFIYTVEDGFGGEETATVTVTVEPFDPLVANDDAAQTVGEDPVIIDVLANDTADDNGTLSVTAVTQPANGTVTTDGTTVTYTAVEDFFGEDTFTYTVSDGLGGEETATVTVTVAAPPNQAPVAVDDTAETFAGQPISINVLANDFDPDGDPITFASFTNAVDVLSGLTPDLYWACLPDSGSVVPDQSGNGQDGQIVGNVMAGGVSSDCGGATPIFADGSALILNTDGTVLPSGNDARTIVVRYRASTSAPANIGLYGYGTNAQPVGQFSIARTGAGNDRLIFASWGNDNVLHFPAGSNIGDGEEHTIVVTYDGAGTLTPWFDGVAGSNTTIAPLDTQISQVMLGQTLYGAISAGAEMRHFAIYSGVLSAAQIQGIHDAIEAGGTASFTQPADGTVTLAGLNLLYTPNPGFAGVDTFTYTITDGNEAYDTATVTVTVNAVPLAANDDDAFTQQDTPVTVSVLDNDEGTNLSVLSAADGTNGAVTTDGTAVTYTPSPGFWGVDTFEVTVTDGADTQVSTVTVTVNGAPFGDDIDDETEMEVPVTIDIVSNITDPEGGPLTITGTGTPSNGTVVIDGGNVVYTPALDFMGMDSFTVTIEDDADASVTITVTVLVTGNTPPVAVDDSATTTATLPVTIDVLANDFDPDGDPLTIHSAVSALSAFQPDLYWACLPDSGSVVPDESGNGQDGQVIGNVVAGDVAGDCGGATPIFADGSALILNASSSVMPAGNEARTIILRFRSDLAAPSNVGLFGYGTNALGSGQFSIARTAAGNDRLIFASWGNDAVVFLPPGSDIGDGNEHTIAVTYDGSNLTAWFDGVAGPPTPLWAPLNTVVSQAMLGQTLYGAISAGAEMRHFAIYSGTLTGSRIQAVHDAIEAGAALGYTQPANGTVTRVGDQLVYTANIGFVGTDSFTYTASDRNGGTATATVTVEVEPAILEANDDNAFTQQDAPVTIDVLANDLGDDLEVVAVGAAGNGVATTDGTSVTYTPEPGFWGTDTFTVDVTNGFETQTSTVTVTVNGAPVGPDLDDETTPETPVTVTIVPPVSDPEGGPLTITSAGPATNGTVVITGDDVVYTPAPGFVGTDTFEVTIEDEDGGSLTITVTVLVNTPLVANDDTAFTQQDSPVTTSVLDNDEGDDLVVASVSLAANGTATSDGTTVTYTPNPGFWGTDTVLVEVQDGTEFQVSTLTITVNGAPVGDDLDDTTRPETPVTVDVLSTVSDPEGGPLTITSAGPAANGTVAIDSGNVVYTPAPGFVGTDSFEVTIEDADGGSLTITVTILVHVTLVANDDTAFTQQDVPVTVAVLDNDEGDVLSIVGLGTPANGSVTTDDTTVTYTPNPGFWGTDSFTVTVEDAIGGEPTATSKVTVTVNGAPVGDDIDAGVIQQDTPVTVGIVPPVFDPEGGPLTITGTGSPANGSVVIDGNSVVYTPNPGYNGPDAFTVTIDDADGGSLTITVTVYVNAPPAGLDLEFDIQQDEGVGFNTASSVTDPDGDDVAIDSVSTPANGSVTTDGMAIEYIPNPGFWGTDSFEVTVVDDFGATATFTVTVNVNGAPIGDDIAVETPEDVAVDIDVLAGVTDPEGGPLAVTNMTDPASGLIAILNGVVTYTPFAGFIGTDFFDVTIDDEDGGSLTITVTVTVTASPRVILNANACVAVVAQGGDAGYTNHFWLEAPGTPTSLGISNKSTVGTMAPLGTYAAGTELVLSIHVQNTGQVFMTGPASNNPDNLVHVALTPGTGDLLYTIGFEDLLNGGDNDFNDAIIDLVAIDCDVTAGDDAAVTEEDVAVDINVLVNDSTEHGTLEITSVDGPANGVVTQDNGVLTYTPFAGFSGADTFTYTVENGLGGSATATVTITVNAAPRVILHEAACVAVQVMQHGPVANTNHFWLEAPGTPTSLGITNFDIGQQVALGTFPGGTELVLSIHVQNTGHVFMTGPASNNPDNFVHAVVTPGTGSVLYTVGFEDLFNGGDEDYNDAILDVITIDCDVTANDDTEETDNETPVQIDVLANDSTANGSLEVTGVTQPANGSVTTDGSTVTYTPDAGFVGTDTFTYTVENGLGGTVTATVTVEVEQAIAFGDGKMTGGGNIRIGNGNNAQRYNWGFVLRCDPNSQQGLNFQYHDHANGVNFHLQSLDSALCSDDPAIGDSKAAWNTIEFTGTGRLNGNGPTATIEATLTDQGEPGRDNDTIQLVIRDADGHIISTLQGAIHGGNHRAHDGD